MIPFIYIAGIQKAIKMKIEEVNDLKIIDLSGTIDDFRLFAHALTYTAKNNKNLSEEEKDDLEHAFGVLLYYIREWEKE